MVISLWYRVFYKMIWLLHTKSHCKLVNQISYKELIGQYCRLKSWLKICLNWFGRNSNERREKRNFLNRKWFFPFLPFMFLPSIRHTIVQSKMPKMTVLLGCFSSSFIDLFWVPQRLKGDNMPGTSKVEKRKT